MDTATQNALLLGAAILFGAAVLSRVLRGQSGNNPGRAGTRSSRDRLAPFGTDPAAQGLAGDLDAQSLEAALKERYARKILFRVGVLLFSLLALAVCLLGQARALALVLLAAAGLCQYGVYRQKTTDYLAELLRRGSGASAPPDASVSKR